MYSAFLRRDFGAMIDGVEGAALNGEKHVGLKRVLIWRHTQRQTGRQAFVPTSIQTSPASGKAADRSRTARVAIKLQLIRYGAHWVGNWEHNTVTGHIFCKIHEKNPICAISRLSLERLFPTALERLERTDNTELFFFFRRKDNNARKN